MPTSTARLALPRPVAADPDNVPGDLTALTDRLEVVVLDRRGGDTITASGAAVVPLVVKGALGQNASLLEARDDAAALKSVIDKDGNVGAKQVFVGGTIGQSVGAALSVVNPNGTTNPCLVVRALAAQTADMASFQNSSALVLASVTASGAITSSTDFTQNRGFSVTRQQKSQGAQANGVTTTHTFEGLPTLPAFGIGTIYSLTVYGRNVNTGARYVGEFRIALSREGGAAVFTIIETRNLLNGVGTGGTNVNISGGVATDGTSLLINVNNATGGGLEAVLSLRPEAG